MLNKKGKSVIIKAAGHGKPHGHRHKNIIKLTKTNDFPVNSNLRPKGNLYVNDDQTST
jgi:hypothetical protein